MSAFYQFKDGQFKDQQLTPTDKLINHRLSYGDGFFSTLGVCQGKILWQDGHAWRLVHSAAAFELDVDAHDIMHALSALADTLQEGILKILITRTPQSVQGYGFTNRTADIYVKSTPVHIYQDIEFYQDFPVQPAKDAMCLNAVLGIRPPRFVGVKLIGCHEQVFAHRELLSCQKHKPTLGEGLVKNVEGDWISGTMSNVMYRLGDTWHTPFVGRSGVSGVARMQLLKKGVRERALGDDDLVHLTGLFFCNAVRGILPIKTLNIKRFHAKEHPLTLNPNAFKEL